MKHTKIIAWILALVLLLPCLPMAGHAAGELDFSVAVSPETASIGGQAVVTVSLEGYDTEAIAGLQVDLTGIESDVLEVVSYASAIDDADAASNKASYNTANQRVRLLYLRQSGILPTSCKELLKLTVRLNPNLTGKGSTTLPVTVKIVTADNRQLTLTSSCTICYADVSYVAQNTTTNISYATLDEALSSAKAGETVSLLTDHKQSIVVVPAGVVIDLNGHVIETQNLISFGAVIDTAETVGGIRISVDTTEAFTKLQPENGGYLPIYDKDSGVYRFYKFELVNVGKEERNGKAVFAFKLFFENMDAYRVLAESDHSGIRLTVNLVWSGITVPYIPYRASDTLIRDYAAAVAATGNTRMVMTIAISGLDNLVSGNTIEAAPVMDTISEVSAKNDPIVFIVS